MLVVRVELWPGGNYRKSRTISTMIVGNISQLAEISDYDIRMHEGAVDHLDIPEREEHFELKGHRRKQSVWAIIAKAAQKWLDTTPQH